MPNARLPYLPALDGLRALAIIAVLIYHAQPTWLPGGFLGVDVFFVISAYLITTLLMCEYQARSAVALRAFWARRARRLLPAAFVLIALALLAGVCWLPDEVAALRSMSLAAAGYVTNWYLIVSGQSYFASVGRPSLLRHLWSLAVEEQFYLLWPPLLLGLLRIAGTRVRFGLVCAGILVSTLWMANLYEPGADPSRVYFGSDTRAATLLVGAALALIWSPWRRAARAPACAPAAARPSPPHLSRLTALARLLHHGGGRAHTGHSPSPRARAAETVDSHLLSLVGLPALAALTLICLRVNEGDDRLYRGGLLGVALLGALAIAAAADARSLFARVLERNPLRWIGLRSYSLYLWHWPVFMLTRPQLDLPLDGLPLLALRMALAVALAELSYQLVELPVRRGALGAMWRRLRARRSLPARLGLAAAGVAFLMAFALLGRAVAQAAPPETPAWLLDAQREELALQRARANLSTISGGNTNVAPPASDANLSANVDAGLSEGDTATIIRRAARGLCDSQSDDHIALTAGTALPRSGDRRAQLMPEAVPDGGSQLTAWEAPIIPGTGAVQAVAHATSALAQTRDPVQPGDSPASRRVPADAATAADPKETVVSAGDSAAAGLDEGIVAAGDSGSGGLADSVAPAGDSAAAGDANFAQGVSVVQATAAPAPARPVVLPPVTALLTPERAAEVSAIGDSVMLSAVGELHRVLGPIDVDAKLGRQSSATVALLRARRDAGLLGPLVVIQSGDNGYLSVAEMRAMLELTGGARRVVFINLHVPRAWEQNNNDILRGESQSQPNVVLVDWSAASAGHPEYFWSDGMHLRPEGARAYATLVAAALATSD